MSAIRYWTHQDVAAIAEIMAAHALWQHYGVTRENAEVRLLKLSRQGEWGFVAEESESGAISGFVLFNGQTFGESGYVRLLGVRPGSTSGGLGAVLLKRVEEHLLQQHIYRVVLLCTEWNDDAQKFYRRQGYDRVGRLPDWVMPNTAEVIFAKHLGR